ncbi:hypothetical protein [Nonomuraea sp. NPDC049758]|uniref:hypothetical protein n=1 Tax=Nonomuraea sp. NPDC049758 TaxID=3154360 RepID=UPI0034232280
MIAVYVLVGLLALVGLAVVLVGLAVVAGVVLDVRRDRRRIELERLAGTDRQPDLDPDPSLDGLVVEISQRLRRAQ